MFEKVVTAVEPFGLTMVVIAGLILSDRIQVADRGIVGVITVFIGVALILVHIIKQIKSAKTVKTPTPKRKEQ